MEKNLKKQNILWFMLFVLSAALMTWKLPFGFGGDDEGFYLTIAHRLSLGERLFTDEWHLSQLSSFFLYPFVKTYRALFGGTEGILLASRIIYLVVHSLSSAIVYFRLRRISAFAVLGSIFFMLFTPFDMMTLSYNTIALDMLALTAAFAAPASGELSLAAAGAFFACAVVCCPYLAIGFALYGLICFLYAILFRKTGNEFFKYKLFTAKTFQTFTSGILFIFALFLFFLFSHTGIKEIISALPGIFSDPEHPSHSVWYHIKHYIYCIIVSHRFAVIPVWLYLASIAVMLIDRKRTAHTYLYIAASALCTVIWLILMSRQLIDKYFNGVMVSLSFMGLTSYLLLKNKPRDLFVSCFILGFLYSVCVCSTSNMGFDILSIGFPVMNIAGLIFIGLFISEQNGELCRRAASICFVPILLFCSITVYVKIEHCFWDASPTALTAKISEGPAKGIVTNEYFKDSYDSIYKDMQCYHDRSGSILVYSQQAWEYFIPDTMNYASFSAWLSGLDDKTEDRLSLYYAMNPHKLPDDIYIPKTSAFGELNVPASQIYKDAEQYGYAVEENEISYKLKK